MDKVILLPGREMFGKSNDIPAADALTFVKNHPAFTKWVTKLQTNFGDKLKKITVSDIYTFPPSEKRNPGTKAYEGLSGKYLGFVLANAEATKNNKPVAGFAFIRGGAVAVLPILQDANGNEFVLTLIQPRVPGAEYDYEEIPAGMLDGGAFGGVAAKEMEEETGLKVKESELTPLCLMYPSIGGCDENIKVYLYRAKMSNSDINMLRGKATGNPNESEMIITKVTPFAEFKKRCLTSQVSDVKAQVALGMYEMMKGEEIDMEGNAWKAIVDASINVGSTQSALNMPLLEGGSRRHSKKHTRKSKKSHKKGTRKH
jgi:ADP-sugar diphosphatase